METTVTITWKAFAESRHIGEQVTSVTVTLDVHPSVSDLDICNWVYRDTNKYQGDMWDMIEPLLSNKRTHTALSVGDEITINDNTYRCEPMGWSIIEKENA